jgi:N-acetylneuraminic acid mutarotase
MTNSVDVYFPDEDRWEYLAPMSEKRSDHAAAVGLDGTLYVFGGCYCSRFEEGSPTIGKTEAYDPKTNTWSPRAPMPEPRQLLTASTAPDGRIFVVGGLVDLHRSGSSSRVDIYDPKADTWKQGPSLALGRHAHAQVTSSDGLIYVLGGFKVGGAGPTGPLDSVEILDPAQVPR